MIAAIFLAAAPALTAQEAQTLPVREIAQRVLGAAGALVIDVERPRWPSCVGLCPPQRSTPEGPPPVKTLTLYTRASATTEAGWLGLCRATAIDVSFDENGAITGLQQSTTVGWLGELTRERTGSATAGASASSIQYAEFEARCGALATTRSFVRAFGALDGERALIAVALIHNSMATGGPIRVTCTIDLIGRQPCGTASDLRALADDVTVAKISGIEQVDPRTGLFVTGGPTDRGCYDISLAQPFGSLDQIRVCVLVASTLTITQAAFTRARVVY